MSMSCVSPLVSWEFSILGTLNEGSSHGKMLDPTYPTLKGCFWYNLDLQQMAMLSEGHLETFHGFSTYTPEIRVSYVYLEPKWPLFWLEWAFFGIVGAPKQKTHRFQVYNMSFLTIFPPCTPSVQGEKIEPLFCGLWFRRDCWIGSRKNSRFSDPPTNCFPKRKTTGFCWYVVNMR